MPAPSPISLSAPTAPRWSRFSRIFRPCWMMAWLFLPLMCATKPTPQASCSFLGWYRPWTGGRPMRLASIGVALGGGQDSIWVFWDIARSAVGLRCNVAVQETDNTPAGSRVQ
ncbi:hypothetical protein D9M68_864060 [compost metagenome]